jgi:Phosphopantetheine attachment site
VLSQAVPRRVDPVEIDAYLRELFGRILNVPGEVLSEDESFFSLGLTSLLHQEVIADLTKSFGELSGTVLFEYPNLSLLGGHLTERGVRLTPAE